MEDNQSILYCLRFLGLAVSGFLTVVFFVMVLIAGVKYTEYGSITEKTIRVSGIYLALTVISGSFTIIMLDPTKALTILTCIPFVLLFVVLLMGGQYLSLAIAEKGLRKMFAPVWRFLKRLISRNLD